MLSLVVPVYRNEQSLGELLDAIEGIEGAMGDGLEAVFVVDGSPDRSYEILREALGSRPFRSRLVLLSRNFGSFAAIRAGLEIGAGDRFAVMAADLQEPPELIVQMDHVLRAEDVDIVLGVRAGRSDPLLTRLSSRLFWAMYRRYVVRGIPPGGVDVFACNKAFRDQLLRMEERHSSLIAQVFWLGFRRGSVSYQRRPRKHGRSAWTLARKLDYLMDSVFSFTDLPIRLLVRLGGAIAILSGLFGLFVVISRLSGLIEVPGFTALIVLIIFFGALNLFCLGLVGSYAWRAYENTKARPLHVVLACHEFSGRADGAT